MQQTASGSVASPTDTPSKIRAEIARRRIRQTAIADRLGISQQQISARLNGRVPFTVDQLVTVAEILGVPTADLLP